MVWKGSVRRILPAIVGLFLCGCPEDDVTPDGGTGDSGRSDTGADSGPNDGGNDSGTNDSGTNDTGANDTGAEDTGVEDVGFNDAGGGGSFTQRVIDMGGVHGQGVEVLDFEGDGDLDVIVAFSLSDTVRIYLNDGNASFTTAQPPPTDSIVAMHAVAGDFDGDGDRDIAAAGLFDRAIGSGSQGEVTWFENPGDPLGSWTRREITGLTIWYPIYLAAGDLTGDGAPDLVVGCNYNDPNGNGVFWFRNEGGAFSGQLEVEATLSAVRTVLIHDVDGDGVLDVLAVARNGDEVVWFENLRAAPGDPTFARHTIAAPPSPFGMRLANLDGDAELELVVSADNGVGGQITWYDPPADPRRRPHRRRQRDLRAQRSPRLLR
jgi:hypothetical protein